MRQKFWRIFLWTNRYLNFRICDKLRAKKSNLSMKCGLGVVKEKRCRIGKQKRKIEH